MVIGIIMALWVIVYIAFRTPPVQKWVTGKISDVLSKQLNTTASLKGLDIDWFDEVVLDGVYVEDQQGDTLVYVEKFRVNIEPWALLHKNVYINLVEVQGMYANLYQPEGDTTLNYAFIPEAFASEDTTTVQPEDTTASSWIIDLYQVQLSNIRFAYDAEGTEMDMALRNLSMLFNKLGLEESHIQADELSIDGLQFAMLLPPTDTTALADTTQTDTVVSDTTGVEDVLNPSGYAFSLNEFSINDSKVVYQVKQPDTIPKSQLNFENMTLADITTRIEDIEVGENNASLYLENFAFREARSGFALNEFEVKANIDMPKVQAELINLETGNSQLNGQMNVSLSLEDDMNDLIKSLRFESKLDRAKLSMADAAYFTGALDSLPDVRSMDARLSWNTLVNNNDGKINNLLLTMGDQVKMDANMNIKTLTAALDSTGKQSPYVDFNLNELSIDLDFIRQFATDSMGQYLPSASSGPLVLTADAQGSLNDIKATAKLNSGLGSVETIANYALNKNNIASFNAQLVGSQLNIREVMKLLGNPDSVANAYNQLTFHADASGVASLTETDTTLNSATAKLTIDRFDYSGHDYRNLVLDSRMQQDSVQANIGYQDSLLELHANAQASLDEDNPAYAMSLQLKDANLYRLNLVPDSIIVTNMLLQANATGSTPDDIIGSLALSDAEVVRGNNTFALDSFLLEADKKGQEHIYTLTSDQISAKISGLFDFENLPNALTEFQNYYLANYEITALDTLTSPKKENIPAQQLAFTFSVDSTPTFVGAFVPELNIPVPITASGKFNSENRSMDFNLAVPRLAYGTNIIDSMALSARTSQKSILLDMGINTIESGGFSIPNFQFQGDLSGKSQGTDELVTTLFDFMLGIGEEDAPYRLDFNALLKNTADTTKLTLDKSELVVENEPWKFTTGAELVYADQYLDINDFSLTQGDQKISVNTKNDKNTSDLMVAIQKLALGPLMNSLDLDSYGIEGMMNVEATLADFFQSGPISANMAINGLEVQKQQIGEFDLKAEKGGQTSTQEDLLSLAMSLKGETQDIDIDGTYNLATETDNMDLRLKLNRLSLEPWQVFAEEYIKTLKGKLQADMQITGSPSDPVINGNMAIAEQVTLQTTIAGATHYIPEQKILFGGKNVRFNEFTLLDSAQTKATLDGEVSFANLSDPEMDLSFVTNNFILVNSQKYENPEFYGKAIGSADMNITGPSSDMMIDGSVSIDDGTNMSVAMVSGDAEAAQAAYIEFVDVNDFLAADTLSRDSLQLASETVETDSVQVSGFSLSTNIHVSPEAKFTIVIDPSNGDKVVASGEADLKVDQNVNGDMTIQGTYTMVSGSYNLSFAGLVSKEFTVRNGSTITWSGDPANADLNMTAVYSTETDLEGLLSNYRDLLDPAALNTELQTNVLLNISGTMTEPDLSFGLEIPDLSSIDGPSAQIVQDVVNQVLQDETQMYKQVFGLIVLNRFIPVEGGAGGGGSSEGGNLTAVNEKVNSSVSRLLSSQLSSLSEDYLGGVEINVGLDQSDDNQDGALADRDLNVELSKSFGDRLTVSAGGVTTLSTGQSGGATTGGSGGSSSVMAQFEVLYRIDKTGNLNIRIFQSPKRNALTNEFEPNAGVSLMYQKSFSQFSENNDVLRGNPENDEKEKDQSDTDSETESKGTLQNDRQKKKNGGER